MINYRDHITSDSTIMLGKPVIKGTRITVEQIVRKLSEGATVNDLMEMYPSVTADDISAALLYTAELLANESLLTN
jgi:uncharacterized protein (DUF433 family)